MAQNWNLQDIRPPERKKKRVTKAAGNASEDTGVNQNGYSVPTQAPTRAIRRKKKSKKGWIKAIGIFVLVGVLLFALTPFLRNAEITVYPKHENVTIQASFTAYNQPASGELGYELLTFETLREETVSASGKEEVEERASGNIVVYNEYSSNPQRLIKNTRFESEAGRIYRIPESVVVPGFTKNGEDIIPGSIVVEVFADESGDAYNLERGDFTIPGLKGSDQFDDMYATVESPIIGGFTGLKFIVEDDVLTTKKEEMITSARDELLKRVQEERPSGTHYFDESAVFSSRSLPSVQAGDEEVVLREEIQLAVPLFINNDFARYIAGSTVVGYEGEPVRAENLENIGFAYASTSTEELLKSEPITFALSGNALLIWDFDTDALKEDLLGSSKTAIPSILGGYPAIIRAESKIRPFWKRSFPQNSDDIEIIEKVE